MQNAGEDGPKGSDKANTAQSGEDATDSEKTGTPKTPGISAMAVLWTFGKCISALLPVYLAGYYRMSTSFVVFGLMVYSGWKHSREAKEARLRSAIQFFSNEQEYTTTKIFKSKRDVPAWVSSSDVEKVEWLNKVLQQAWPFIGQYLEKLLVETIAPAIRGSSNHLQTFNFTKIDMGDKSMKVVGVKAHTENDKGQVLLDVYISYVGNVEINVEVKRYFCKAGVKGIQLHGMMRVILEPLIGDVPIVGAVTMFFIRRPKLDINWTGMTNLLDIPGLNVMSDSMIMDIIASFLVLPNRLTVPLVADLHVAQLRSPLPRGVVRIHLLEAADLVAKDNFMKGMITGMSDPYALIRVGPQCFTSRHVDNTVCPKWGEMYEVIVHEVPGQELEVEVYDKDTDQDDFLGRAKLDLGIVKKSKLVDEWFPLKDTKTGRVHFRLEWLTLLANTDKLEEVIKRNSTVPSKFSDPPSAAILAVYLDRAEALPIKKGSKEPSPMVQLSVQDTTKESRTCWNTVNPEWEDAFTFFIQDPYKQDIDIQVKDNDRVQSLGSLSIPLSRLLSRSDLSLDQWFQLESSGQASRIYINTVLRVLWIDEAYLHTPLSSSDSAATQAAARPKQTTPDANFATEGVLRIHLVGAQNVVAKDKVMGLMKGKSDPYVKIRIGGKTFKSDVIKGTLNPNWNEMYEVVLTQLPGQEVLLEMFDKDMDKDDFMGRLKIKLSDIISAQYADQWYTLNDVKSGRIHLIMEWLPTVSKSDQLEQVLQHQTLQAFQNKAVPSAALLFVCLERAHDLPMKKSGKEPKAAAELVLGNTSYKTKVCERSSSPQWDESFYFLVRDPNEQRLQVKLSSNWDQALGSLVLPVRELLSEPELILDQWLSLDGAPASQILLRAELKILGPKMAISDEPPKASESSVPEKKPEVDTLQGSADTESSPVCVPAATPSAVTVPEEPPATEVISEGDLEVSRAVDLRPQQTTPDPRFGTEGVLRIHLREAQNLVAKDKVMGLGKGNSDPYVKIHIGDTTFKSQVVKKNLNPTWNEMYELVLVQNSCQEILFELFDKDMDKDDFLGRLKISMNDIVQAQYTDEWFTLSDVKSGRLHLTVEWMSTVSQPEGLEKLRSLQSFQNKAVPSAALLFVYLERAHSLPLKKSGKEPKPAAEIVLGGMSRKTQVCGRSTAPQWEEAFHFPVHDPTEDILIIKLSSNWDQALGSLVLPVRELLSEPQLVLDQWFKLDGALDDSQILLRAELKILESKVAESAVVEEVSAEVPDHAVGEEGEEEEEEELREAAETAAPTSGDGLHQLPTESEPETSSLYSEPEEIALADVIQDPTPMQTILNPTPEVEDFSQPQDFSNMIGSNSEDMEPIREAQPATAASEEPCPQEPVEEPEEPSYEKPIPSAPLPAPSAPEEVSEVTSPPALHHQQTSTPVGFGTEGVLRIHLLEAQNLVAKDKVMGMGKGKSDPYVKIYIGDMTFKSHVIKENLNPTWNEMYELVLKGNMNLDVKFEVFDKDLDSDDFLGRFKLRLSDIINSQFTDQWYTLNDIKSGQVHLLLEWLPTASNADKLDQVLQLPSLQSFQNKAVPSAALLFVYLEMAHSLPLKKSGKEPKPAAELVLGGKGYKTKVCDRSTSPQWGEAFYFLVHDPKQDMLIIKLSSNWDQALGSLVLPVRELLSEPQLVLDQWFKLDGALDDSQILLRAELKVLESKLTNTAVAAGALPRGKDVASCGQVKLSLSCGAKEKKLCVTVHGCRGLVASSKDIMDTYISLILLPDKSKATKRKTGVKRRDLNPEYNERFEFDLSLDEAKHRTLCVCVKNNAASFMSRDKDVVGQVQIELGQIDLLAGVTEWFDLGEEQ
ncbi:extended synaptotagmin-1 isoform X2 [Clupea harengus]|uniref:Extended synaptotagmin-1 isoform X2 n=1 Tax=Clupea harengus TaxID=7950 RepID=A0A6P8FHC8_CLUHA|nr:extended synaptotagmin-1 isoform X2 [Clupea harengus]